MVAAWALEAVVVWSKQGNTCFPHEQQLKVVNSVNFPLAGWPISEGTTM